ncbi:cytochrome P450 52A2 [Aspergillus udagawae]|uniref:Cytochrome P450 52A2 n=1 Tax=Aspergillus udagawae TaxID=91492 RepID=A0ABQ1ARD1_9EURO|nr:cytochrome P450 52A2 [Aspergillus udagawae]
MYATPNGIFAAKGLEEWKKTRKVFRAALANNREICNLSVLEEHVGRFLRSVPLNRTGFNIQATFADLCTDIMTSFALGASADQLGSTQTTSNEHFVKNLNYIKNTIAKCGRLGPLHHLYSKKRFQIACDGARKHVVEHVDQELAKPGKVSDGNQSKRSVGGSLFLRGLVRDIQDVNQLSDHCLSILLAAIDSMTTVLSATFFLLAKDKRVTEKLRATILENVGYEHPTYEQLQNMKYLHYVLNEVRKGTIVVISVWASHRMSEVFRVNATEFFPERWEVLNGDPPGYLPFLQGPRACPGRRYAMIQISYIVTRILQAVSEITDYNYDDWKEKFGFGFENANGVFVGLA